MKNAALVFKAITQLIGEGFLLFLLFHLFLSPKGNITVVLDYWYSLIALSLLFLIFGIFSRAVLCFIFGENFFKFK